MEMLLVSTAFGTLVGVFVGSIVAFMVARLIARPALMIVQDRAAAIVLEKENAAMRQELEMLTRQFQPRVTPAESQPQNAAKPREHIVRHGSLRNTVRPSEPTQWESSSVCAPPSDHSALMFDVFICYRTGVLEAEAERLSLALIENDPLWKMTMFWDKRILIPEVTFRSWIARSGCVVILLSNAVVHPICSMEAGGRDMLLNEFELAIDKMLAASSAIASAVLIPVFVGEYDEAGTLNEFSLTNPDLFPDHHSGSCTTRTIRETMAHIFSIDPVILDPRNINPAAHAIAARLYEGFPSKFAAPPPNPPQITPSSTSPSQTRSTTTLKNQSQPQTGEASSSTLPSAIASDPSRELVWAPHPPDSALYPSGTVPERYVRGLQADGYAVAAQRWEATLRWRQEQGIDTLLDEPQPHYEVMKQHYPHFFHKRTKDGRIVYYERPGHCDLVGLRQQGVEPDAWIRHFIFITEVTYRVLASHADATSVLIIDASNVTVADVAGDKLETFRALSNLSQSHYVERCGLIFVVNTTFWFRAVWNLLSPFVHKNTRAKMRICGPNNYQQELCELIGAENVPVEFGGSDTTPLGQSAEEKLILKHVREVLAKQQQQQNQSPQQRPQT